MSFGSAPNGRVPDLMYRYALASTPTEVLDALLEDLRAQGGYARLVLASSIDGRPLATAYGVPEEEVGRFAASLADSGLAATSAEDLATPETLATLPSMTSPVVIAVAPRKGLLAAVAIDGDEGSIDVELVRGVLRQASPFLAQSAERYRLRRRLRALEASQHRARSALGALPDPVLVMDSEARIQLANPRAEQLFVIGSDDSQGRRHALETNNLYFSAFRARAILETRGGSSRELVLVDPTDGSDLLFEVFVVPFRDEEGTTDASIFVLRDITDLKFATHELEIQFGESVASQHKAHRESERLNVIIENAGVPILVTDPQANVILMNREAERLLAVGSTEGTSSPRLHDIRDNDVKLAGFINEFMLQPRLRREGRLTLVDPDEARELPSLAVSTKILDEHYEPTAVVTLLHDLTQEVENQHLAQELQTLNAQLEARVGAATRELAERNAQLEAQSAELERASRLKSEFLATMSHELRTPINAVLGYSSLLRDGLFGDLEEEQQDALQRMRNAAEHLLTVINDILDLSRVEAGQIQVSATDIDLRECLETLSESVRPMAHQKHLEYVVEIDPTIPGIRTDVTRLRQVLLNLLSNAVKFTERGSVTLRAFPVGPGNRVRMEVIDTGIGIAESDLEMIFEEFTQADQSATRQHGGTGLGLTISRRLIQVMGGSLGVASELGAGAIFFVELPILPPITWGDSGLAKPDFHAVLPPGAESRAGADVSQAP